MTTQTPLELRVLSGLHVGAALPLDDAVTVGNAPACDVILLDPGVSPLHLSIVRKAGALIVLTQGAASVRDTQGQLVADGSAVPIDRPMRVGKAWIVVCDPAAAWQPSPSRRHPSAAVTSRRAGPPVKRSRWRLPGGSRAWWSAAAACGAVFTLSLAAWGHWHASPAKLARKTGSDIAPMGRPAAPTAPSMPAVANPATVDIMRTSASPTPTPTPLPDPEDVRTETLRILRERRLADIVNVQATAGNLYLDGQLDKSETERFERALLALQERFNGTQRISAKLTPLANSVPFAITEVFMGPGAHITLAGGVRVHEGEMASPGLRLVSIRAGKLVFAGRRQFEVAW